MVTKNLPCNLCTPLHVCIYTFQQCFFKFLKAVKFMPVWFLLFNMTPMKFFSVFFFFLNINTQYIHLIQIQPRVHCQDIMYTKDKYFGAGLLHLPSFWISNRSVSGKRSVSFTLFLSKLFKFEWLKSFFSLLFSMTWTCFQWNTVNTS